MSRGRRWWIAVGAAVLLFPSGSVRSADSEIGLDRAQSVAAQTIADLRAQGLPGALVGLASGSGGERRLAAGLADVEAGTALRIDHRMRIGSVAKLVVGTLLLQFVDEGRLGLDDPISTYVENVPQGGRITLRMLGTHRSGLFNPLADPALRARINADPAEDLSFSDVMEVVVANSGAVAPNTGFSYSNANTLLLAKAIETVAGKPLSEVMRSRIGQRFAVETPLIPADSRLPDADLRGYRFGGRRGAVEYGSVFFDATAFSASWAGAAGNMNATLDDLLVLARPLASGETLGETSRRTLHDFQPLGSGIDYGFHIARFGEAIGHAGDVPGFSSFLAWVPRYDLSIVVLCNLSNLADKRVPAEIIGRSILEALSQSQR